MSYKRNTEDRTWEIGAKNTCIHADQQELSKLTKFCVYLQNLNLYKEYGNMTIFCS